MRSSKRVPRGRAGTPQQRTGDARVVGVLAAHSLWTAFGSTAPTGAMAWCNSCGHRAEPMPSVLAEQRQILPTIWSMIDGARAHRSLRASDWRPPCPRQVFLASRSMSPRGDPLFWRWRSRSSAPRDDVVALIHRMAIENRLRTTCVRQLTERGPGVHVRNCRRGLGSEAALQRGNRFDLFPVLLLFALSHSPYSPPPTIRPYRASTPPLWARGSVTFRPRDRCTEVFPPAASKSLTLDWFASAVDDEPTCAEASSGFRRR
jgi:hypothetical protein